MNSYKVPQSTRPRKTKTFDRVVGQAVALVVPDSYRAMVARLNAPQPQVALTVRLIGDQVKSIKLAGERDAREARGRMTKEHPFMVKMLAGYTLMDRYELRAEPGVIVESYTVEEPVIIQTAPTQALVVVEEPEIKALTPAQEIAMSLKAEYPELGKAIDLALAAVEAGLESSYDTRWDNAGKYGTISCNCPQAVHRNPRTRYGAGCKHGLALTIRNLLKERQADVRNREVEKRQERRAKFATDAAPGDGGRLAGDYAEMKPTPAYQQMLDREAARRETALPAAAQAGSILDWLDYGDGESLPRKSGTDIIREIEAENAERYARENARYATATRPDPRNLEHRPNVTLKGIGHR